MIIPIHDQILWYALTRCARSLPDSAQRYQGVDPRELFLLVARGSWINDVNQATIALDFTDSAPQIADDLQLPVFREMWRREAHGLRRAMQRYSHSQTFASAAFDRLEPALHANDIGSYNEFDHLDVLFDEEGSDTPGAVARRELEPSGDFAGYDALDRTRTLEAAFGPEGTVHSRLVFSSIRPRNDDRLDWASVTSLGRAAHTISDFFSHTNYVELLLWVLAESGDLPAPVVQGFNRVGILPQGDERRVQVPLPVGGVDAWDVTERNRTLLPFWYGASAASTPLFASMFAGRDTVFSLLEKYATHLDSLQPSDDDEYFDFILSVLDPPGRGLMAFTYDLATGIGGAQRALGSWVRRKVADILVDRIAANSGSSMAGIIRGVAEGFVSYRGPEARKWARAGRLRYVMNTVQVQLADEMREARLAPQAPRHCLLAKDEPGRSPEDRLRFRLASLLATEVTAEVFSWHFEASEPSEGQILELLNRRLRHPARQLAEQELNIGSIKEKVWSLYGGPWPASTISGGFFREGA